VLTPVKLEDRYKVLGKCDVVVLCSICQEPLITKDEFENALSECHSEPFGKLRAGSAASGAIESKRLIIDLGSPRNAEASIGEIPGVQYVCVDDLEKIVSENRRLRMVELEAAQKILKEGLDEFLQWYRMDEVSKDIRVHADRMVATANEESEKLLRSMPDLPENERERIRMMYERFAKKMANDYLYKVKAGNSPEDVKVFLKCLEASDE
jgi:glutamyl-tRNA reductase